MVDEGHVIQPTWNLNSLFFVSAMAASTAASLNDFVSFLRRTLKTRIMYCKNAQASNGPRKMKKTMDHRLTAQARVGGTPSRPRAWATRQGCRAATCEGDCVSSGGTPFFGGRVGLMLLFLSLFRSIMLELGDFQDMMAKDRGSLYGGPNHRINAM